MLCVVGGGGEWEGVENGRGWRGGCRGHIVMSFFCRFQPPSEKCHVTVETSGHVDIY